MTNSEIQIHHFSTGHLPLHERIAIWRENYGKLLLQVDIEPAKDIPFEAWLVSKTLPGLQMMKGRMSPARISRTIDALSDGNDDLVMVANRSGETSVSSCGRQLTLGGHDAVLMMNSEATSFDRPSGGSSFALRVPRAALLGSATRVDDAVMRVVPGQSEHLKLLLLYASALYDESGPMDRQLQTLAISHVHDLMSLVFCGADHEPKAGRTLALRSARLKAVKSHIAESSHRRDFSIGGVAIQMALTSRYIQRLFEADGTTFSEFLLHSRLARAHRMLCRPEFMHQNVSTVAYDAGFGDLSYFNRSFRRVYGMTPKELRQKS
jgi:AraC-like DNA-binding protein